MAKTDTKVSLHEKLDSFFQNQFILKKDVNLYYELFFDKKLTLYKYAKKGSEPDSHSGATFYNPKRGYSSFQTDLAICEKFDGKELPRVIIECKSNLTTHDILTYNAKAELHKRIYPWLRYGIIDIGLEYIPAKFYMHNTFLDFFIAAKKLISSENITDITDALNQELRESEKLKETNLDEPNYSIYRSELILK